MKVRIEQEEDTIEAEEILHNRKVTKHGTGAHILVPKRFEGCDSTVLIHEETGAWMTGYLKKYPKLAIKNKKDLDEAMKDDEADKEVEE